MKIVSCSLSGWSGFVLIRLTRQRGWRGRGGCCGCCPCSCSFYGVTVIPVGGCYCSYCLYSSSYLYLWQFHPKFALPTITEHTNISETRVFTSLARHLGRSSATWDRRCLIFTDSMVALGALGKGRASDWGLRQLTRVVAARQIGCSINRSHRYCESDRP